MNAIKLTGLAALGAALTFTAAQFLSSDSQPTPGTLTPVVATSTPIASPSDQSGMPQKGNAMTNPLARAELEFIRTRDPLTNTVPQERLWAATARAHEASRAPGGERFLAPTGPFNERGPSNIGGRTRAVVWDPDVPNKVWAGSVSGGLWFTPDITVAGLPWQSVDDFWENLAVTSLAYDPGTSGAGRVWYAGTGEGVFNFDALRGAGIFKSTDGGASWAVLPSTVDNATFHYVQKIVVTSSGVVLAATRDGIQRSVNGGASWTKVLGQSGATNASLTDAANDLEIASNGDLYAGMGLIFSTCDGVYKSTAAQGGSIWVKQALPGVCNYERVEVATAPSNSNTVYVATQGASDRRVNHVFRTDNAGASWSEVNRPFTGAQAWYDMIMAVDPNNASIAWVGAVRMHRSIDGGINWLQEGDPLHPDHHAIAYRPGSSTDIAFGNDGGMYYSGNANLATIGILDRNDDYNVTQYYGGDIHPGAGSNVLVGGTQDNGTHRFNSAGIDAVDSPSPLNCCDGGFAYIDQTNSDIVIGSIQNGRYYLSTNGGVSFSSSQFLNVQSAPGSNDLFINPGDFDDTNNILYGNFSNAQIFRCDNVGVGPISCSSVFVAGQDRRASAFTVSPYSTTTTSTVYFGTLDSGRIFKYVVTLSGGAFVSGVTVELNSGALPTASVSSIAVGASPNQLLVTFSNFGIDSVWETTDGGSTWFNKDDNNTLPDVPVRSALYDPNNSARVLLGTDAGLWGTEDLGGAGALPTWERDTSVPLTRVDQMQYRQSDGTVMALTHGRGVWTGEFGTPIVGDATDASLRATIAAASAGTTITFAPGLDGQTIALTNGQLLIDKDLTIDASSLPGGVTISGLGNNARIMEITSGSNVTINNVSMGLGDDSTDGGAIYNAGTLTLIDATLFDNESSVRGGAIFNFFGDLTLRNVTMRNNIANSGGALYINGGALLMENTTIHDNFASFHAGVFTANANSTLIHSTITDNGNNLTVAGGGLSQFDSGTAVLIVENSIIASNTATTSPDLSIGGGTVTTSAPNLIGNNATAEGFFPAGPLVGTAASPLDPLLGPLTDNGGPTFTRAPLAGSPVVDQAVTTANSPATDQRGFPRPVGAASDLGAVEATLPPSNDAFVDAIDVSVGGASTGTLELATRDGSSSADSAAFPNEADVWYRYVASDNGTLRVNTCGSEAFSNINTVLSVHLDDGGAGTLANELAANELWGTGGDPSAACPNTYDSSVAVALTFGDAVLIRVSRGDDIGGLAFNLAVAFEAGPPLNDAFSAATLIGVSGDMRQASLAQATQDGSSSADSPSFPNEPDVWFRYVADSDGTLQVDTCGSLDFSNIDTVLSVHADTGVAGTPANELAANDNWQDPGGDAGAGCGGTLDSALALSVISGQSVLIRVSRRDQIGGLEFNLNVTFTAGTDTDGDGIFDSVDNCTLVANPDQRDTNGDGYGNICDADLDNSGVVNAIDLGQFRSVFFTSDADADFNGDGVVNPIDLGLIRAQFFGPPGPSGLAP